jgi:hypothetical protein
VTTTTEVTESILLRIPSEEDFGQADYIVSYELDRVVELLIANNPQQFGQLAAFDILTLWKKKGGKSKGKATLGTCSRPSGVVTAFTTAHFVISISADHIRDQGINGRDLEAICAHELMHAGVNEKGEPEIWPHDSELFAAEIRMYGLVRSDLRLVANAFAQAKLNL